ncbi:Permease of the drug/metabolite transporter (DMT) superfamily [Pseudomonas linyingensis]|uniref:Permease of the drug/metabolite transporter (DMT) superfamily n=1 Tax=Pseudomonas linyingensis TaxID=915471 RepID=A0A1H6UMP7_9PSED|nr:DMT family transporter [Pseudomonas linyingensis]SEI91007.1 Permease of the drug/metabolite transporter (DMT) superfamily [Pseudomonas linyingensis]
MTDTRQGVDGFAVQLMVVLCVIWGLQQVVIKLAAPDMAPMLQIGLRSMVAAVLVVVFMLWQRQPLALGDGTLRPGLLAGLLFALEFLFVAEGLRYTSAAHVVVLLYTAPIFAALGLHLLLPSERLRRLQWLGIGLAFGGIVIAFGAGALQQRISSEVLLGDALALLAGLFWGMTTVAVRCSSLSRAAPAKTLLYQLLCACLLVPLAWLGGQVETVRLTPVVWGSLLYQSVLVSFVAFLTWFWLLRRYLASRLGVFSFMTPLFGVVFGVWLLDERIDVFFVVGGVLVLLGITMVSADGWWRRVLRREPSRQSLG